MEIDNKNLKSYSSSFGGEVIQEGHSDFHHYKFVKNDDFGVCLFLDGIIQSSAKDQEIYHNMMVSQALEYVKTPKHILIIGGAGGGILHHVFKLYNDTIETVQIVDIDQKLYELTPQFLEGWC